MAPAPDLVLKDYCTGCRTMTDLYGSNCGHLTLCLKCGKSMAEIAAPCSECGVPVTRLIKEYNVRAHTVNKQHFIGRFLQGMPIFSKKKSDGTKWSLQREGLQGRQSTEAFREKYKQKLWILEDDIGLQQFQGQLEGGQQATYFVLLMHGSEFLTSPAGAWYNFNKVANYKQLTLEEAEEQMKNRRKTADGYQRWMMKASTGGDAGKTPGTGGGAGGGRRKPGDDDDDMDSDKGDDEEDDEFGKKRLNLNKAAKGGDEDGEELANDVDLDEEEPERGDDWEHEETFTDDDEAVGNDPEERDEQVPEGPAPPEIKQDEEEEELNQEGGQGNEEGQGGLSKSGRELKKLLGKQDLDDSDGGDDDEEEDEDVDLDNDEVGMSPVLAPTKKDAPKEKDTPSDPTPAKGGNGKSAPATTSKGKRKAPAAGDESKPSSNKKAKADGEKGAKVAPAKKESAKSGPAKGASAATPAASAAKSAVGGAVSEEEVKVLLKNSGPIKSQELVAKFKSRLKNQRDKTAFAAILKKISRIQKLDNVNFIVLRDKK